MYNTYIGKLGEVISEIYNYSLALKVIHTMGTTYKNSEEIARLRQWVSNVTPEQVENYKQCMRLEASVNSGLPVSVISMALLHTTLPKKLGRLRPFMVACVGLTGYTVGRLLYIPICSKQAFGVPPLFHEQAEKTRLQNASISGHGDAFDQEINQSEYNVSTDGLLDAESEWKTFDSRFDSDTNTFDDMTNRFQQDEANIGQNNAAKRVTYDNLWTEHKNAEAQYMQQYGYTSMSAVRPDSKREEKKVSEDFGTLVAEPEESPWELK